MSTNVITNVQLKSVQWKVRLVDVESLCQVAASAVWQAAFESDKIFEVTIALADNVMVQELNLKYRNQNKPTNVLSFPLISMRELCMEIYLLWAMLLSLLRRRKPRLRSICLTI